jgi:hypothetical protein
MKDVQGKHLNTSELGKGVCTKRPMVLRIVYQCSCHHHIPGHMRDQQDMMQTKLRSPGWRTLTRYNIANAWLAILCGQRV